MNENMQSVSGKQFNERAQHLLRTLIERYIREGQPVGSRTLARDSGMELSPATVRNVMADLEELGLIAAPHTSAGRIPTAQGYRVFVDSLLTVKPMDSTEIETLKKQLSVNEDTQVLITNASAMLSNITQMAGLVTVPRRDKQVLQHVEFLPLSPRRILVILVLTGQEVQNRIIRTDREYSQSELQQAANFLNAEYAGLALTEIRQRLLGSMQQSRDAMQQIMENALSIADQVLNVRQDDDYIMAGETNLMNYAEMADIDKLRQLFDAFNTKRDLLHLLDKSLDADGMQIFIGEESGYQVLDDCSVVTAPYKTQDEVIGVLGVIGPTRMAYDRVIPIVDVTAKLLSALLRPE